MTTIRSCIDADVDALRSILAPVIQAGETYALPRDLGYEEAIACWIEG